MFGISFKFWRDKSMAFAEVYVTSKGSLLVGFIRNNLWYLITR